MESASSAWDCPECTFHNYRDEDVCCQICGASRPEKPYTVTENRGRIPAAVPEQIPICRTATDWSCSTCTLVNTSLVWECDACGTLRKMEDTGAGQEVEDYSIDSRRGGGRGRGCSGVVLIPSDQEGEEAADVPVAGFGAIGNTAQQQGAVTRSSIPEARSRRKREFEEDNTAEEDDEEGRLAFASVKRQRGNSMVIDSEEKARESGGDGKTEEKTENGVTAGEPSQAQESIVANKSEDVPASSVLGNNQWLAMLHAERMARRRAASEVAPANDVAKKNDKKTRVHSKGGDQDGFPLTANQLGHCPGPAGTVAVGGGGGGAGGGGQGGGGRVNALRNGLSGKAPVSERGSEAAVEKQQRLQQQQEGYGSGRGITILTYNVWFKEDVALDSRMKGLGDLITKHEPDVICLQEVTPNIYSLFERASWWRQYRCSLNPVQASSRPYFIMLLSRIPMADLRRHPFNNSIMGRELCIASLTVDRGNLTVATTHLESPCPAPPSWNQMYSAERVAQAKEALDVLQTEANVVFCGDMNWNDKLDGPPPLPKGWVDAWEQLRPGELGLTYDCKANAMLTGRLRSRLDRLFCKLDDFVLSEIHMIGTTPIPGATYQKEAKVKKQTQLISLPILPSDHFGLLLKVMPKA